MSEKNYSNNGVAFNVGKNKIVLKKITGANLRVWCLVPEPPPKIPTSASFILSFFFPYFIMMAIFTRKNTLKCLQGTREKKSETEPHEIYINNAASLTGCFTSGPLFMPPKVSE